MRRQTVLAFFFFLLGFTAVSAAPAPPAPPPVKRDASPAHYLSYLTEIRAANLRLEKARADLKAAQAQEKKDKHLAEIDKAQYEKGILPVNHYKQTLHNHRISAALSHVIKDRITAIEAQVASLRELATMSAGEPLEVDVLHALHMTQWQAECDALAAELQKFEAEFAMAKWHFEVAKNMYKTGVGMSNEVLAAEVAFTSADQRFKIHKHLESQCMKGLPSLEDVKKIPAH